MTKVRNLEGLAAASRAFVEGLVPRVDRATLVTLSGELGAGKTAFVKEAAKALGVQEDITSPTFVLEKTYSLPPGSSFTRLVHIDAYRLEEGEELSTIGFDERMSDPGNLIMLEWPERVSDIVPRTNAAITITVLPEGVREIDISL